MKKSNKKKQMIFVLFGILFSLVLVNMINAQIGFVEHKYNNYGTGVVGDGFIFSYNSSSLDSVFAGQQFEAYYLFSTDILGWNNVNPNNKISFCEIRLIKSPYVNTQVIFDENYTADNDIQNRLVWALMDSGDIYSLNAQCHFLNLSYDGLDMPIKISANAPTLYCKACQFTDFSQQYGVVQANNIDNYTKTNWGYIFKFFGIVYEIGLYIFWCFLIVMLYFSIGIIFWGFYYVWFFFARLSR